MPKNLQRYPDVSKACSMMVMPLTGLMNGNGLYLLGGERDPELAMALGFEGCRVGFVYDPGRPDPDFGLSLAAVGSRVAALIPTARFVMADLAGLSCDVRKAGGAAYEWNLARIKVRRHVAGSGAVPAPVPERAHPGGPFEAYRHAHGQDIASIIERSLARSFPDMGGELWTLPFTREMPGGGVVFCRSEGDAILVGIGEDPSDDRRTMTLAMANELAGNACYVVVDDEVVSSHRSSVVEDRIGAWLETAAYEVGGPGLRPF